MVISSQGPKGLGQGSTNRTNDLEQIMKFISVQLLIKFYKDDDIFYSLFKYDESQGIKESYDDITKLVDAWRRRQTFN